MARNVIAQVLGGQKRILDGASTVSDVRRQLGIGAQFAAQVNGSAAGDSQYLDDQDFVTFAEQVKGA